MSHIPTSELAALTGYSKRQIQRMAENGEIPKAQRSPGGHWVIPDSKPVRRWIACHRKAAMPEKIDHGHRGSLNAAETHQLAKEIHIKANSLRRALRQATWFPGHPIWNWVWQDLEPLRVTLESLCMPIDQALDFIQKEKEKRPVRGRSSH